MPHNVNTLSWENQSNSEDLQLYNSDSAAGKYHMLRYNLQILNYPVPKTVEKHHILENPHFITLPATGQKLGHMERTPELPTFNSQINRAGCHITCFTSYISTLPKDFFPAAVFSQSRDHVL